MWISIRKTVLILSFFVLSTSILLSICIRTTTLPHLEGKYLLGTDAYHFLRQAERIVSEGQLPDVDIQRWQPEGRDLTTSANLFSFVLAYTYHLLHRFFRDIHLYSVAVYSSISCYMLCLLVLYGLWRNIFSPSVSLLAVNFTAIFPTLNLHRSSTGFGDRDAFVLLLWLLMYLFYMKTESTQNGLRNPSLQFEKYFYAALSGITAGLLALTWEGSGLATAILTVWLGLRVLRAQFSRHDTLIYSVWYLCFMIPSLVFTRTYHNIWLPYTFLTLVVPTLFHIYLLFFSRKMGEHHRLTFWTFRSLFTFASCTAGFISLVVLTVLHPPDIQAFFQQLFDNFVSPLGNAPLMQSIAELTDLSGLRFLATYSVAGLAAMAGCGLLAHHFFSHEKRGDNNPKKGSAFFWFGLLGFETILCGTVFSLFITDMRLSFGIYSLSLFGGGITIAGAYLFYGGSETLNGGNNKFLFILIWALILLFISRGAERYLFFLDVLLAVMSSFLILEIFRFISGRDSSEKGHEKHTQLELYAICLLVVSELYVSARLFWRIDGDVWLLIGIAMLCTFLGILLLGQLAKLRVPAFRKSAYLAMILLLILLTSSDVVKTGFVRASTEALRETVTQPLLPLQANFPDVAAHTDKHATIAAWWDYGSLLNYFTKRATLVDGEHYIPSRLTEMARYVFSGLSPTAALAFLRAHHATHLLITTNELLRLDTITHTGVDSSFPLRSLRERVSGAAVHFLTPIQSEQMAPAVERTDFIIPHNFQTMDTLSVYSENYPPGKWHVRRVSLTYDRTNDSWGAMVHGSAGSREFSMPPSEFQVDSSSITSTKTCVPGSVVVFSNDAGKNLQVFYVSARARLMLTVRLYLFMEDIPGFSLIYDTNATARCEQYGIRLWKIEGLDASDGMVE